MAKKSGKKPAEKPDSKEVKDNKDKDVKNIEDTEDVEETKDAKATAEKSDKEQVVAKEEETSEKKATITSKSTQHPMKGFFARKCDKDENILTIFKSPKIWGALIGEAIGTMLVVMFMLMLGIQQPLYFVLTITGVYLVVVGLSGAHLNPLVTAGMMATRRVSAIRGVLYMLAQLLGGWIGLLILNGFRMSSESQNELPMMSELAEFGDFLPFALIELLGAFLIAFCFARALRFARKNPLAFSLAATTSIAFVFLLGMVLTQAYYGVQYGCVFNPVVALMYRIIPTVMDVEGGSLAVVGFGLLAYVVIPMIGGVIGFYLSDVSTRLACGGYFCKCDEEDILEG